MVEAVKWTNTLQKHIDQPYLPNLDPLVQDQLYFLASVYMYEYPSLENPVLHIKLHIS